MNLFGIPVELSVKTPRDQALFAPAEIVNMLKIADAAETTASHGIISRSLAESLGQHAQNALTEALHERRPALITGLTTT
jgi:hypothetical protein